MTPFAAGCAICGADLEAARAELAAKRQIGLPRPSWLHSLPGNDSIQVVVAFVLALAASPIGLLLAVYWAIQHHRSRDTVMVFAMLAAASVAVAALVSPVWFWRHIY